MSTRVKDVAGQSLIVLFFIKPTIDLFWAQHAELGALAISPLHLVGVLVFFYFGFLQIRYPGGITAHARLFQLFIVINVISVVVALFYSEPRYLKIIDLFLRVLDSYIIFRVAYNAGLRQKYMDHYRFLGAIALGASIAVLINLLAMIFGFGGAFVTQKVSQVIVRDQGLYYDPGVLGNIAVFNLVFVAYVYKEIPKKLLHWRVLSLAMVPIDLYMVYISVSRAAVLLVAVFGVIYLGMVQKGIRRVTTVVFLLTLLAIGSAFLGHGVETFEARFESEKQALSDTERPGAYVTDDRISFGSFEGIGNNRVRLWALTLDNFLKSEPMEIIFGNFFKRSTSHSDYFDVLTRNGVLGLFIYVGLLMSIWVQTLRLTLRQNEKDKSLINVLAFTLISLYIVYAFPFRPLAYTTTAWYMWAIIGFCLAKHTVLQRERRAAKLAQRMRKPEVVDLT